MESVTLKLKRPITFGKKIIDQLTFKEVTGEHMRRVTVPAKRDVAMIMELVQLTSGEVQEVIDKLAGSDLTRAMGVVGNFIQDTPETGEE